MRFRPLLLVLSSTALFACAAHAQSAAEYEVMKAKLAELAKTQATETRNLANFDDLDFNVYSGQKWDLLSKSHSSDIAVHYPDGHITKGLPAHIEELKSMFVFAPDAKVREHPIRIASGDWTAVSGTIEGTFSRPMDGGGGKMIAPTGKPFKLSMVTIGHWKGGVMDEEWLMWDNMSFMKQIGLAP